MKKIIQVALDGPGGAAYLSPYLHSRKLNYRPSSTGKSSVAKVVAERLGSSLRRQRQHVSSRHPALHVRLASDISSPVSDLFLRGGGRVDLGDSAALFKGSANRACVCSKPPSVVLLNDEDVKHFDQVTRQHNHSRSNPSFILGIRKNPRRPTRVALAGTLRYRVHAVPVAINHPDIRAILAQSLQRAMARACR